MDDKTETQAKAGAIIVPVTLFEQNCTIIWHEPTKKAVVIESRGGLYSSGPAAPLDGQETHLRNLLGFIGIADPTFVRAEKLGYGPEAAEAAIAEASEALGLFAGEALKLAA